MPYVRLSDYVNADKHATYLCMPTWRDDQQHDVMLHPVAMHNKGLHVPFRQGSLSVCLCSGNVYGTSGVLTHQANQNVS